VKSGGKQKVPDGKLKLEKNRKWEEAKLTQWLLNRSEKGIRL